jgi:hypothetical protein
MVVPRREVPGIDAGTGQQDHEHDRRHPDTVAITAFGVTSIECDGG